MNKRFVAGSRIVVENMLVYCIWKDVLLMVLVVFLVTVVVLFVLDQHVRTRWTYK